MPTMTWMHTRKGTPMKLTAPMGQLLSRAMMIRTLFPNHPIQINNLPV